MREKENRSRTLAKRLRRNLTSAEAILWTILKGKKLNGYKFRKQHPIGSYIVDFACISQKLVVEVDGATHSTTAELAHDLARTNFLKSKGWHVLRVGNLDIYNNLSGVVEMISAELPYLDTSPPPPPPAGENHRQNQILIHKQEQ